MPLNPPPQMKSKEKNIEDIINKGGKVIEDVIEDKKIEKDKLKLIPVRMPERLLNGIDKATEKRIGLSRNAWILEAIQEKLKREE